MKWRDFILGLQGNLIKKAALGGLACTYPTGARDLHGLGSQKERTPRGFPDFSWAKLYWSKRKVWQKSEL